MTRSREGYLWTREQSTAGLTTDSVLPSSSNLRTSYDVVVIGAGFAGLIAARNIQQLGNVSVLIVEGRDRIGGRTWTAKALGEEFEMGGTWVHWNQPHLYHELHRYGLHKNLKTSSGTFAAEQTFYKPTGESILELPGDETNAQVEETATRFFNIDGLTSYDLMPYPHDPFREPALWKKYDHLTVRQRLDQLDLPQLQKEIFETMCNSFGSAPGTEIGFIEALRWYALGGHSMARMYEMAGVYKIGKGGMTSFARAILRDFGGDISMNTVISEINQSREGAFLRTSDGRQIKAEHVVSTIPLNCLSDIKFFPPIKATKAEAAAEGHLNLGAKIHFKLTQTLPGWFASCNSASNSPFCFAFSDHNGTTPSGANCTYCIGFGYNGFLKDKNDAEHIIESFKMNVRPDVDVQAYLTHDWMNDPLAKGVWSCWGPKSMSKYLPALQESHGRVVFASADWADGWRGFVDGAIEQGQKAAREIKALLLRSRRESAKL